MEETIIIVLLIWLAVWQFIHMATIASNQGYIIKEIEKMKKNLNP